MTAIEEPLDVYELAGCHLALVDFTIDDLVRLLPLPPNAHVREVSGLLWSQTRGVRYVRLLVEHPELPECDERGAASIPTVEIRRRPTRKGEAFAGWEGGRKRKARE